MNNHLSWAQWTMIWTFEREFGLQHSGYLFATPQKNRIALQLCDSKVPLV